MTASTVERYSENLATEVTLSVHEEEVLDNEGYVYEVCNGGAPRITVGILTQA